MDKLTLVTVVGPEGPAEVALPTTATIGALIPQIAEICLRRSPDDADLSSWTIGPVGGPPFSAAASVAQLGVTEGAVLELREQRDPSMELIGSDAGVAMPSAQAPPGGAAAEAQSAGPAGEPPIAAVDPPGPVEAPPALAAPPVGEPSVLERTRAVLPRRVTLGARVGAAAGAVAPPPAISRARPALAPAVTAPSPRPTDLTRRRTPV
ncbi:MAG TPA: EsaB/YukD family protein, partial [Candidatus Dormibacteraeota bacterium]